MKYCDFMDRVNKKRSALKTVLSARLTRHLTDISDKPVSFPVSFEMGGVTGEYNILRGVLLEIFNENGFNNARVSLAETPAKTRGEVILFVEIYENK